MLKEVFHDFKKSMKQTLYQTKKKREKEELMKAQRILSTQKTSAEQGCTESFTSKDRISSEDRVDEAKSS